MSQRGASIRGPPGACQPVMNPAPCNVQQARRVQVGSRQEPVRLTAPGCENRAEVFL
jgi:hypothetical protein